MNTLICGAYVHTYTYTLYTQHCPYVYIHTVNTTLYTRLHPYFTHNTVHTYTSTLCTQTLHSYLCTRLRFHVSYMCFRMIFSTFRCSHTSESYQSVRKRCTHLCAHTQKHSYHAYTRLNTDIHKIKTCRRSYTHIHTCGHTHTYTCEIPIIMMAVIYMYVCVDTCTYIHIYLYVCM